MMNPMQLINAPPLSDPGARGVVDRHYVYTFRQIGDLQQRGYLTVAQQNMAQQPARSIQQADTGIGAGRFGKR